MVGLSALRHAFPTNLATEQQALGLLWAFYIRTPGGRLRWDHLKLRLPLVGDLLGKACVFR